MPATAATTPDHKFKVYTSGQKRRLTPQIKREFKRRAAIEPVIGLSIGVELGPPIGIQKGPL